MADNTPTPADVVVPLDDISGVVYALHQARADEAAAKERRLALEDAIKDRLGEAGTAGSIDGEVVVTYREGTTTTFDKKAMRADHPELVGKYEKTAITRRFNVK